MFRSCRCALVLLFAACQTLSAGPLTPPAGPITSTMKTLEQMEPRIPLSAATTPGNSDTVYRITAPGSYYMTEVLTVQGGFHGIVITASNVTLDLNGMTIHGTPGSKDGITNLGHDNTNVHILNGTVREMGGHGIRLERTNPTTPRAHRIDRVTAIGNSGNGIFIVDGSITSCVANQNTSYGMRTNSLFTSLISECSASNNHHGIGVSIGSVLNSTAESNTSMGINVGQTGVIEGCVASSNGYGFAGANYRISNSTARKNSIAGIQANIGLTALHNLVISESVNPNSVGIMVANSGSRIEGNTIVRQGTAIRVTGSGNLIVGNRLRENTKAADIVAGNRIGTLQAAPSMSAVNGNTGGGSMGTTDPNANILY